jgi:acylphosphatase
MIKATRFKVKGKVQGVGYRAFVERNAKSLGLVGWVRNEPDGTVEGVIEGEPDAIAKFEERIRSGPRAAVVNAVDTIRESPIGMESFEIRK